ncbi:toprim domain-containing protein [uncultured Neglectibacter sp.]|uniref:toprim domain-containing protein n=1 Tax=uncultured Neglectibacter sp. TaxID=1924108 RepID=UPI0034DEB4A6
MIRIREAVVVEGKYDKIKLSSLLDGTIVTTDGFGIFRDREKMAYLRRLAENQGLVVLTDSDGAGFVIRGKISSCIPASQLKHAYIPDIPGKERRKAAPSKEGMLGVEGMELQTLRQVLRRAGATLLEEESPPENAHGKLTKADLYEMGLSGREDSAQRRKALQKELDLPERLSAGGLLQALNALYSEQELSVLRERLIKGDV